jgi:hypothetical protein
MDILNVHHLTSNSCTLNHKRNAIIAEWNEQYVSNLEEQKSTVEEGCKIILKIFRRRYTDIKQKAKNKLSSPWVTLCLSLQTFLGIPGSDRECNDHFAE